MTEPLLADVVPLPRRPHVLYRMYGSDDRLLYIGITADVDQRFTQHGTVQPWWREVAVIRVEHFDDRASVEAAEREAIRSELPAYNRTHLPKPPRVVDSSQHTPVRATRMDDERWDRLGDLYGQRNRSAVLNEVVAWLIREPGAKLPARATAPPA